MLFNCWKLLKIVTLQRKDEISLSVICLKSNCMRYNEVSQWTISSQAPNRRRFNDHPSSSRLAIHYE
nr:MAG TPA: hypothetical protein [Caudoviricetes sp.]